MVLRITKSNPKLQNKKINSQIKPSIKCAISISNKVSKKSVVRNRLRRLFHQHLTHRLSKMETNIDIWAFISLKPNCMQIPTHALFRECDKLLFKAGLAK
tara:strand:+ start:440 stop:739 length:300 start_codon:yes stop_codon:yes gene_type:complete